MIIALLTGYLCISNLKIDFRIINYLIIRPIIMSACGLDKFDP